MMQERGECKAETEPSIMIVGHTRTMIDPICGHEVLVTNSHEIAMKWAMDNIIPH